MGGTPPTAASVYPVNGVTRSIIQDDLDGDNNDIIANGATFSITFNPGLSTELDAVGTLLGLTQNGDPIIEFDIGGTVVFYTILSNSFDRTGPIGTIDVATPLCFLEGTMIAAPDGAVPVETLAIGQPILTADGRTVPVKWIGRQSFSTSFGLAERLAPVRVTAGALGRGLPERDLVLTADHALLLDGVLINAGVLVNGATIDYVPRRALGDGYTIYHIETENHDVILAEGTPAETYIDYVARRAFDNYAEYVALYGEDRTIPEMSYPRISSARLLPKPLQRRLSAGVAA